MPKHIDAERDRYQAQITAALIQTGMPAEQAEENAVALLSIDGIEDPAVRARAKELVNTGCHPVDALRILGAEMIGKHEEIRYRVRGKIKPIIKIPKSSG